LARNQQEALRAGFEKRDESTNRTNLPHVSKKKLKLGTEAKRSKLGHGAGEGKKKGNGMTFQTFWGRKGKSG